MSAFTMARFMDIGGEVNMKVMSKEVRLNEDFKPVLVLTIEFPLSLEYDPQSYDEGVFFGRLEDAILEFDKETKCSLTPKT